VLPATGGEGEERRIGTVAPQVADPRAEISLFNWGLKWIHQTGSKVKIRKGVGRKKELAGVESAVRIERRKKRNKRAPFVTKKTVRK